MWKRRCSVLALLIFLTYAIKQSLGVIKEECCNKLEPKECDDIIQLKFDEFPDDENGTQGQNTTLEELNCCLVDQILDKEEADYIRNFKMKNRVKRSTIDFTDVDLVHKKWPMPIDYQFAPEARFSSSQISLVEDAFKDWEDKTCVRFRRIRGDPVPPYFLNITSGSGCLSFVGRSVVEVQPQPLYLGPTCFLEKFTITHEIGHALGMWHPHQQSGSEKFITLNRNNIAALERGSFLQLSPPLARSTNDIGYDYASVLHYGPTAFSFNKKKTIATTDSLFEKTIGQRVELSFRDVKAINDAYCLSACNGTKLDEPCQHGGYQDVSACKACICPDGWEGSYCQRLAKSVGDDCGGSKIATTTVKSIQSPRYGLGSNNAYPKFQFCAWTIKTESSSPIKMRFKGNFRIACINGQTCHDRVEIRFRKNDTILGPRFCCEKAPSDTFVAEVDEVVIVFKAFDSRGPASDRQGFRLEYFVAEDGFCASNPCVNGGTCQRGNTSSCNCPPPYTGSFCQIRIGPCDGSPCLNNGTCLPRRNNFICRCPNGFIGSRCGTRVEPCNESPCLNNGTCIPLGSRYICRCAPGFSNRRCEDVDDRFCISNPCLNGGTCTRGNPSSCSCQSQYTGPMCNRRIGPCNESPCLNNGTCIPMGSRYICRCAPGFSNRRCEDGRQPNNPCSPDPCKNGATCVSASAGRYYCICPPGYRGVECENDLCTSTPCLNNGTCSMKGSRFECSCPSGYSGIICHIRETDHCGSNPCQNGATCVSLSNTFICICPVQTGGRTCARVANPCQSDPCRNGGTCVNLSGDFLCACPPDSTGRLCEESTDPCDTNPCRNGGTCFAFGTRFLCACTTRFQGVRCTTRSDPCQSRPCLNGGTCSVQDNSFSCTCAPGMTGRTCNTRNNPDQCQSSPCRNGGVCYRRSGSYGCLCPRGFSGMRCTIVTRDPCQSGPCSNGGTCIRSGTSYTCRCPQGFSGRTCSITPRNCGACGQEAGCIDEACGPTSRYSTTCRETSTYTERSIWGVRSTRTRVVYRRCTKEFVRPETARCCHGAQLIRVNLETGERKCAVPGWSQFKGCQGHTCGGCGRSQRDYFSILTSPSGLQFLQSTTQQSRSCHTTSCSASSCSLIDRLAGRCRIPCCAGMRLVGSQCIRTG